MKLLINTLTVAVLCAVAIAFISIAIFISSTITNSKPAGRYDCGMAEWHPDIPTQAKQQCRNRQEK